jgi:hypothetical protein
VITEPVDVLGPHRFRGERQLDRIITEGPITILQIRLAIVDGQLLGNRRISGLPTEVPCMGKRSVVAGVGVADHGCQHLPLRGSEAVG